MFAEQNTKSGFAVGKTLEAVKQLEKQRAEWCEAKVKQLIAEGVAHDAITLEHRGVDVMIKVNGLLRHHWSLKLVG